MILYSFTKFGIKKNWINIPWFRRFDLLFFQTSKQISTKLQYTDKFYGKFQRLASFPRKMFYSSSKFCIFETFRNNQSQRIFNLSFWQTSEQVYRKLQHGKKNLCKVSKPASPSQNTGFTFVDQIWHYKDLNQYSTAQKIWFTLHTDFKSYL